MNKPQYTQLTKYYSRIKMDDLDLYLSIWRAQKPSVEKKKKKQQVVADGTHRMTIPVKCIQLGRFWKTQLWCITGTQTLIRRMYCDIGEGPAYGGRMGLRRSNGRKHQLNISAPGSVLNSLCCYLFNPPDDPVILDTIILVLQMK